MLIETRPWTVLFIVSCTVSESMSRVPYFRTAFLDFISQKTRWSQGLKFELLVRGWGEGGGLKHLTWIGT